jgi:hypothetical protein
MAALLPWQVVDLAPAYPAFSVTAHLVINAILLSCFACYAYASVSLGFKCLNLMHRGIVRRGLYRTIRHPAYLFKNLAWWTGAIPLLVNLAQTSLKDFFWTGFCIAGWSCIYGLRALSEEGRAPPVAPCGLPGLHEAGAFPVHPRHCLTAKKRKTAAGYFVFMSLPSLFAPVPGTSGEPTVPGPPDVPVLGAFPEVPEVGPEVEPPAPGIAPTPGAPEVAVPTEPEPEVDGLSACLVMERSALPEALALDLDEDLPDGEEELASPDVVPSA